MIYNENSINNNLSFTEELYAGGAQNVHEIQFFSRLPILHSWVESDELKKIITLIMQLEIETMDYISESPGNLFPRSGNLSKFNILLYSKYSKNYISIHIFNCCRQSL